MAIMTELTIDQYLALIWSLTALATLFSITRLLVRYLSQRRLHNDDYWAMLSTISLLVLAGLYTGNASAVFFLSNFQKHLIAGLPPPPDVTNEKLTDANFVFAIVQMVAMCVFWTCLWAGKASMLCFEGRVMGGGSSEGKRLIKWWWAVVVLCILTYVGCVLSNFLTCLPLSRRWSPDMTTNCATPDSIESIVESIKFASAVDVATDLLIMLLPLPLLRNLRITIVQKIGLALVFSLGMLVVLFAFLRLDSVTSSIAAVSHTSAQDLAAWSLIECAVAVIVISLPALRGLLSGRMALTTAARSDGKSGGRSRGYTTGESTHRSGKFGAAIGMQELESQVESESKEELHKGVPAPVGVVAPHHPGAAYAGPHHARHKSGRANSVSCQAGKPQGFFECADKTERAGHAIQVTEEVRVERQARFQGQVVVAPGDHDERELAARTSGRF